MAAPSLRASPSWFTRDQAPLSLSVAASTLSEISNFTLQTDQPWCEGQEQLRDWLAGECLRGSGFHEWSRQQQTRAQHITLAALHNQGPLGMNTGKKQGPGVPPFKADLQIAFLRIPAHSEDDIRMRRRQESGDSPGSTAVALGLPLCPPTGPLRTRQGRPLAGPRAGPQGRGEVVISSRR